MRPAGVSLLREQCRSPCWPRMQDQGSRSQAIQGVKPADGWMVSGWGMGGEKEGGGGGQSKAWMRYSSPVSSIPYIIFCRECPIPYIFHHLATPAGHARGTAPSQVSGEAELAREWRCDPTSRLLSLPASGPPHPLVAASRLLSGWACMPQTRWVHDLREARLAAKNSKLMAKRLLNEVGLHAACITDACAHSRHRLCHQTACGLSRQPLGMVSSPGMAPPEQPEHALSSNMPGENPF